MVVALGVWPGHLPNAVSPLKLKYPGRRVDELGDRLQVPQLDQNENMSLARHSIEVSPSERPFVAVSPWRVVGARQRRVVGARQRRRRGPVSARDGGYAGAGPPIVSSYAGSIHTPPFPVRNACDSLAMNWPFGSAISR